MSTLPLVSCLCVTRNDLSLLKRSINCFRGQSYPNKELVLVRWGEDEGVQDYVADLKDPAISFHYLSKDNKMMLGDVRNISIDRCSGEYFCLWDDDDWCHSDRLSLQVEAAINNLHPASALTNLLVYDQVNHAAYFSPCRIWEGTILCKRQFYLRGFKYPSMPAGEDTGFGNALLKHGKIFPVVSSTAYIYVYHGRNTWNFQHFQKNLFRQPLSIAASDIIKETLSTNVNVREASKALDKSVIKQEVNYFYANTLL